MHHCTQFRGRLVPISRENRIRIGLRRILAKGDNISTLLEFLLAPKSERRVLCVQKLHLKISRDFRCVVATTILVVQDRNRTVFQHLSILQSPEKPPSHGIQQHTY